MRGRLAPGLVVVASLTVLGAASGATINGSEGPDRLRGTESADALFGRGGNDAVEGRSGNDLLHGGPGRDDLVGGPGHDRLAAHADDAADSIRCGSGRDVVNAELADAVAADCEVVSRQLSRDTSGAPRAQHRTQVEPDSFAFGSTIVTTFQAGRFVDGGAAGNGFATSTDGGRTWRTGPLPGLSAEAAPPGPWERVSDPVAAYDAVHRTWLIASLGLRGTTPELLVSRSRDGLAWSPPVRAAGDLAESYDKEWIVCDNGAGSRFRGRCYLSYLDAESRQIRTRTSRDGGLTWSAPAPSRAAPAPPASANGAYPVVRPDGTLVVLYTVFGTFNQPEASHIGAVRSSDGGATFGPPARVALLHEEPIGRMRAPHFVSADVDRAGRIYVAWSDCRFRVDCTANDIVLATSADGSAWSRPVRVPAADPAVPVDHFVPGLAVDPISAGARARLALAYHSLRQPEGCLQCGAVDLWLVTSESGGARWSRPQRLNAQPMPLAWIADTGLGRMTGDYISASFVGGRPVAVVSLAAAPVFGELRQAIFATTRVDG